MTMAFPEVNDKLQANPWYHGVENLSTALYLFDIFLQLKTTIINPIGEEITDRKKIAVHYFQGMFFIDLVSSLPIGQMVEGGNIGLLRVLKLLRINRLTVIINKAQISDDNKSIWRIIHLIFLLCLFMHVLACSW
jgi:hypothetical protein